MSALFARFIALWTLSDHPPVPVDPEALDGAEIRLGLLVPDEYRRCLVAHGAPSTSAALLASIIDQDVDMADVQDFFSPTDIVQVTEEWRALGLPANLIAFASDCSGNLFCFECPAPPGPRAPDALVWLWNQDFDRKRRVAPNFKAWISAFCDIAPRPA